MNWQNSSELAFDFIFSEKSRTWDQVDAIFDENINQIGVACSCHLDFGKFCVFELGESVERIP